MRPYLCVLTGSLFTLSVVACDDKPATQPKTEQSGKTEPKAAEVPAKPPAAKEPSNTARRTLTQLWSTPTGQPSASVAAIRDGHIYALAGPFAEFGTPSSSLVCLALDSGEVEWTYSGDAILSLDGASAKLLDLSTLEGAAMILSAETGKKTTPSKVDSDATTAIVAPEAKGCTSEGAKLVCAGWSVEEGGAISGLAQFGEQICYATTGAREVRCRAADSGDLDFAVAVPAVPEVKDPEAVNFSFEVIGDQLIVGNYDGSIVAFGVKAG